jgi:hypothetical protein
VAAHTKVVEVPLHASLEPSVPHPGRFRAQ